MNKLVNPTTKTESRPKITITRNTLLHARDYSPVTEDGLFKIPLPRKPTFNTI